MALTERLALLISLDSQGAVKGFESIGKAADRNLSRAESKLDRAGQRFQKIGTGMLAAGGLAAAGLYQAGQSAAELEQAVGGTEAVFKDASGAIEKYAKSAARNMGLSETAFRTATTSIGGQLKGVGFDIDESAEKSIELTQVAADLAATFGGTTADAVAALGSAFRGEADPAERFNLRLNQNTVNAKAVELGLAKSTSSVDAHAKAQATLALIMEQSADAQGQFARETDSASGSMAIASAEFENAKASLGQAVAPIIGDVASKLGDLAGGFSAVNEASGGLASELLAYGSIGLGAAGGISFVVGKVIELRESLKGLPGKLKGLGSTLTTGLGGAAMGAAAAGIGIFGLAMFKAQQRSDELKQAARELADEAKRTGKSLEDVAVEKLAREFAESDNITRAMDDLGVAFSDLRGPLQGSADDFDAWAQSIRDGAPAGAVGAEQANLLIGRVEGLRDVLGEAEEVTGRTKAANEALGIAEEETGEKTVGLTDKIKEQQEALQGLLDATLAQFDSNIGYRQSIDNVEDGLAELAATQKEHGDNSEEYRDKLLDVEGSLLDQAAAAVRLYEDTITASGGTLDATTKTALYRDELVKLRDGLAPNSPLRSVLQGYIDQLNRIPKSVATVLTVTTAATRGPFGVRQLTENAGAQANGTSFWGGGLTWVGERGPELVDLPRGSKVYDAQDSARMAGGGGTTIIHIATGADPQAVVEAIKRYTRANGPLSASLVA